VDAAGRRCRVDVRGRRAGSSRRHQAKHVTTIVQKIDLPGDVHLEGLTCRSCGGSLGKESISVKAGAVFIDCEFCGTAYQLDEEPKW